MNKPSVSPGKFALVLVPLALLGPAGDRRGGHQLRPDALRSYDLLLPPGHGALLGRDLPPRGPRPATRDDRRVDEGELAGARPCAGVDRHRLARSSSGPSDPLRRGEPGRDVEEPVLIEDRHLHRLGKELLRQLLGRRRGHRPPAGAVSVPCQPGPRRVWLFVPERLPVQLAWCCRRSCSFRTAWPRPSVARRSGSSRPSSWWRIPSPSSRSVRADSTSWPSSSRCSSSRACTISSAIRLRHGWRFSG